ncbi:MAG: AI-2E family transporter [archaeon]|jgi:predicted PurR-regulated permease PerM
MAASNQYQKVVPFIVFIIALVLLFLLVRPMLSILLGSALLAYLTFPLYKRIDKKKSHKSLSIILSLFIVFIIILIPFAFLTLEITKQGFSFYNSLSNNIEKGALFGISCTSTESELCSLLNQAEIFSLEELSKYSLDDKLEQLLLILQDKLSEFILKIPLIIVKIFLTLVLAYFILSDWENILKKIVALIPMRKKTKDVLIKQFEDITHTVIYAQLFVAFVQGALGAIAFYLLGVPFPIILGLVMAFFALIPAIGTAIIWIPASLYLSLMGYFSGNYFILGKGIFLFIYGVLVISTIDNFLLARIVHKKVKINQIIVIVGVIGGFSLLGVIGIFIGPILLPLLITYFETFKERFR